MEINPIEFGRLAQSVDDLKREVQGLGTRLVWRVDNLETRVEILEKSEAKETYPRTVWHNVLWALLVIGSGYLGFHLGPLVHL